MEQPVLQLSSDFKSQMPLIREEIHHHLQRIALSLSLSGVQMCHQITGLMDQLIQQLYHHYQPKQENINGLSIVAVGGYGRRHLQPYSDLDLLFLTDGNYDKKHKIVENILYALWDLKLSIGHSTRNLKNVISFAAEDLPFKTSLTAIRLVAGSNELYQQLKENIEGLYRRNPLDFYLKTLKEGNIEMSSLDEPILVNEPDVKNSIGGLRGLHLLSWWAKNFFETTELAVYEKEQILVSEDIKKLYSALDFLLWIRNKSHILANQKQDTLLLSIQEMMVTHLEEPSSKKKESMELTADKIEILMKAFYQHSQMIYQSVLKVKKALDSYSNRFRVFPRFSKRKKVDEHFLIYSNTLYSTSKSFLSQPNFIYHIPVLFRYCQIYGCELSLELEKAIEKNLFLIDNPFRRNSSVFQGFLEILKHPKNLYYTASMMHRSGFLGKYIPYFQNLYAKPQFDHYHLYTVDEHTLRTLQFLETLNHESKGNSFFFMVYQSIERKDLLAFSLILHDIGKGLPGYDHVVNGEYIIDRILNAFPLTIEEKEILVFLVNHHLILNQTTMQSDLNDAYVISRLAKKIINEELLSLLLIVTYCDMQAVNHKVLTAWKAELLKELYLKLLTFMDVNQNDNSPLSIFLHDKMEEYSQLFVHPQKKQEMVRRKVESLLQHIDSNQFISVKTFLNHMDENYIYSYPKEHLLKDIEIFLRENTLPIIRLAPFFNQYRLMIIASHRRGLLRLVSAALSYEDITIWQANIFMQSQGYDYADFQIESSELGVPIGQIRFARIKETLQAALNENKVFTIHSAQNKRLTQSSGIQSNIQINPILKIDFTTLEGILILRIKTKDRLFLLADITQSIYEAGYSIKLSRINTRGFAADNTFYLVDTNPDKSNRIDRINELERRLLAVL